MFLYDPYTQRTVKNPYTVPCSCGITTRDSENFVSYWHKPKIFRSFRKLQREYNLGSIQYVDLQALSKVTCDCPFKEQLRLPVIIIPLKILCCRCSNRLKLEELHHGFDPKT